MQSLQLVIVTFNQNLESKDKAPCFSYLVVEEINVLGIHKNELVISKVPMVSRLLLQESRHQKVRKLWGGCADPGQGTCLMHPAGVLALVSSLTPSRGEKKHSGGFSDHASSMWLRCCSLACFLTTLSWIQPRLALDLQSSCLCFQITSVHHHSQLHCYLYSCLITEKNQWLYFSITLVCLPQLKILFYILPHKFKTIFIRWLLCKTSFSFNWRGMF